MNWQPIDTAPKDGRWFLACDEHNEFAYRARWDGQDYASEGKIVSMQIHSSWLGWPPTMWAPLLDPPWMVPELHAYAEKVPEKSALQRAIDSGHSDDM